MNLSQIRSELHCLRMQIDRVDDWVRQSNDMIHRIEEMTFDIEDGRQGGGETPPDLGGLNEILKGYRENFAMQNIGKGDFFQSGFFLK